MDPMLLSIFQRLVADQCLAVMLAFNQAQDASLVLRDQNADRDAYSEAIAVFWASIANGLTAAANASKALWGQRSKPKIAEARRPLRESLAVEDSSPLRDPTMRNHFEHIDERVDEWWEKSPNRTTRIHIDNHIGPTDRLIDIAGVTLDRRDIFRNYDPATGDVIFWGERFNLPALAREAQRVHGIANIRHLTSPHDAPPPNTHGGGR